MPRYGDRNEHNHGIENEERWDLYLDGTGVEDGPEDIGEYARIVLDNQIDELNEEAAHGQWRTLAWSSQYNMYGEDRVDMADPDDADAIAEADLDEGTRDVYIRVEVMASNGAEIQEDRPTWGILDGEGAFLRQVTYEEGDEIADAVARFQGGGMLPHGEFFTSRRVRAGDYWVNEEHPWCYTITIHAAHRVK